MARSLEPTVAPISREEAQARLRTAEASLEACQRALVDLQTTYYSGIREVTVEREAAMKTAVAKVQAALDRAEIPKVLQVAREARADADQLDDVIRLLGKLTTADQATSDAPWELAYREFQDLIENDYRDFASRESYPREADAYVELQSVLARLREIRLAPRLANRNICAVAGGFSSGKSSFLNALIGDKILPTGITSTTSIPTYIFHVDKTLSVTAFNHAGGGVNIEASMFQRMTHDFKRDHGIELKRLVHRVSICTPSLESWANLALIDTPGYTNPEQSSGTDGAVARDEDIAMVNALRSNFMIWVVDCENGTLREQDVAFIRKFTKAHPDTSEERLYLVFNKGEPKTQADREDILREAQATAEKHSIAFAGIGVYSAHKRKWYAYEGMPFDGFLEAVNKAQCSGTSDLVGRVEAVFQAYIDYHKEESEQLSNAFGLLNRISLAWPRDGGNRENLEADFQQRRAYIRRANEDHEKLRDEAQRLQKRFVAAVTAFVEGVRSGTDL